MSTFTLHKPPGTAAQTQTNRRVTVKMKQPNPLFEKWLTEWRDKAAESGSKMQFAFALALRSLKKYPLPLESGRDCKILQGFGDKLCKMLSDKLEKHKKEFGSEPAMLNDYLHLQVPPVAAKKKNSPKTSQRPTKEYVPQLGSGAFAILVALLEESQKPHYPGYLSKATLISSAQSRCEKSFTQPDPGSHYTAWSSMRTLLDKKLVLKESNPAKFSLSDEGEVLATKLYISMQGEVAAEPCKRPAAAAAAVTEAAVPQKKRQRKIVVSKQPSCESVASAKSQSSMAGCESVVLEAGSFEVILLVDNQECNSKVRTEHDALLAELRNLDVPFEVRSLKVGDYLWICRGGGADLVLPHVVERKRMDDVGKSIKDGRFHEQKFRLRQCGLKNVVYLIESYGSNQHVGLPLATLRQAITNTIVHDGFSVRFTEGLRKTAEYLADMTRLIARNYREKIIVSCAKEDLKDVNLADDLISLMHLQEYNKSSSKTKQFRVRDMFVRQLLQIKGMSVEKALAIVERYNTPKSLRMAYDGTSQSEGEKLLASVPYGTLRKNVGQVLSKTVHQLFSMRTF